MMHQSRIWLTVKSILSGTFILLLIITMSSSSVVPRKYWYIQRYYTWQDAQNYCKGLDNHTDLATIFTKSDTDELDLKQYYAWVCWQKNYVTDGFSGPCYSDYSRSCGAVHYNNDSVHGAGCADNFFFICGNPYKLITQSKTLYDAYNYCNSKGGGLVTLSDDNQRKSAVGDQDFPIWIGLQRNGNMWNWSAGSSDYTNWAPNEPQNNKNCASISSLSKNMTTQDCSSRFPFLCYRQDNLVYVEENKTWEEALEYCRALSSPTSYDLVSVQPEDYDYVMKRLVEANTEEVWTGLRFLAGEWLWVNGADMLYSDLPLCPTMLQRCGVLSMNSTGSMEPRDCAERKYFMCYRK